MDVFRLITRGYSNAEIGRELFIGDTTVKTHVTRLLQKLDLRDRAQAIVLAYQTGLFRDDDAAARLPVLPEEDPRSSLVPLRTRRLDDASGGSDVPTLRHANNHALEGASAHDHR